MLWWVIFLVPTLGAICWAAWMARPSTMTDPVYTVKAHRRYVSALSRLQNAPVHTGPPDEDEAEADSRDVPTAAGKHSNASPDGGTRQRVRLRRFVAHHTPPR